MANLVFPTSEQLQKVAQEKLPTLTQDDPIFTEFPIISKPWINLRIEFKDSYRGLQQLRGVGGEPQRVAKVTARSYATEPGVYGEYETIDEKEMLERRPLGQWDGFVDIRDLVMEAQDKLLNRRVDRIRWIMWQLLATGSFYVPLPTTENGTVQAPGHTDAYGTVTSIGQFGMQTATASVAWSTFATSTPMQDLRAIRLLARGRSVSFGRGAKAYMNEVTFQNMIRNTNAADLGGKKGFIGAGFSTLTSVDDVNRFMMEADLPTIVIYDNGYIDDNGTFQLFIPNGTVIVVGRRTNGDPLGNYIYTRNMMNNGEPGPYQFVNDNNVPGMRAIPPRVDVHDGHNGGPVINYPSAIVRLTGCGLTLG